jgi:hypothetical protein
MMKKYKRDLHLRNKLFVSESYKHKARVNLYFLGDLLHRYAAEKRLVVDPMAGAGSILFALTTQTPVICGDIETHWCQIQRQNQIEICKKSLLTAPGLVCRWDAANLPIASGSIPVVLTSSPYYDVFSDWNRNSTNALDSRYIGETGQCYGFHERQLGNIHVYEEYLRAMHQVYLEIYRVLEHGGKLILIIGNRVKNGRPVFVSRDTDAMLLSMGFIRVGSVERKTIPSQWRRIHQKKQGEDYPNIENEYGFVYEKGELGICIRWGLVEKPGVENKPTRQLFAMANSYVDVTCDRWIAINNLSRYKARERKAVAHHYVSELVVLSGAKSGDHVDLHVGMGLAPYLQERLNTFGISADIPTQHCNLGEKLSWYSRKLKNYYDGVPG